MNKEKFEHATRYAIEIDGNAVNQWIDCSFINTRYNIMDNGKIKFGITNIGADMLLAPEDVKDLAKGETCERTIHHAMNHPEGWTAIVSGYDFTKIRLHGDGTALIQYGYNEHSEEEGKTFEWRFKPVPKFDEEAERAKAKRNWLEVQPDFPLLDDFTAGWLASAKQRSEEK